MRRRRLYILCAEAHLACAAAEAPLLVDADQQYFGPGALHAAWLVLALVACPAAEPIVEYVLRGAWCLLLLQASVCACAPHSRLYLSMLPSLIYSAGLPAAAAALQAAQLLGRHPLAPSERVLHYVGAVGSPASKIRSAAPGWRLPWVSNLMGLPEQRRLPLGPPCTPASISSSAASSPR